MSFVVGSEEKGHCSPQFFALIEGVGGGSEEMERVDGKLPNEAATDYGRDLFLNGNVESLPHRGRIIELPGEAMPGRWSGELAKVVPTATGVTKSPTGFGLLRDRIEDLEEVRICLRHEERKTLGPLEQTSEGNSAASSSSDTDVARIRGGNGNTEEKEDLRLHHDLTVYNFDPSHNRVRSFLVQEILYKDEVNSQTKPFIGSISIVSFDGFTSSSEVAEKADKVSSGFLEGCRNAILQRERDGVAATELLKIFSLFHNQAFVVLQRMSARATTGQIQPVLVLEYRSLVKSNFRTTTRYWSPSIKPLAVLLRLMVSLSEMNRDC